MPVKDVRVSLNLAAAADQRDVFQHYSDVAVLLLLHFLSLFSGLFSFVRGDTAHAVLYLFLHGTSQAL